jgi:hypothetical protein
MNFRSFHIFGAFSGKQGKIKGKYAKSHAAAVIETAAALFLCPQQHKKAHYFLSFFAQIKNDKNIAS